MRKLLLATITLGLTGAALTALPPDAVATTPNDCVDPIMGPPDLSLPDDDASEDDASPIVNTVRDLFALGEPLDASSMPLTTALRVRVDIEQDELQMSPTGASYASLLLDGVRVHIVNAWSPTAIAEPADLVLDVGTRDLLGLSLIATYSPVAGGGFSLGVAAAPDAAGGGTGIPLGPGSIAIPGGCTVDAWSTLIDDIPADMPPVHFPKMTGDCSGNECMEIRRSWIRGHIALFWMHLAMEGLSAMEEGNRSYAWGRPGRDAFGELTDEHSAPSYWFGDYSWGRFVKIREVVNDLWNVYRNGKTGGIALRHHCPVAADVGNICFNAAPSAHHAVKGRIEYCDEFFARDESDQTRLSLHEPAHHLWVDGLAVLDTHTHWHGQGCASSPVTDRIYREEVHELATYTNVVDSDCNHRDLATRTPDAYAQMTNWIGGSIIDGTMVFWPAWGDPTPQPPNCDPVDRGTEGCECAAVANTGDYSSPDGDYAIDEVCYDNDGEMTCATTTFNASDTVGICTRCGADDRAAGCTCMQDEDCALGLFCYGADTANGGNIGHCYDDAPPSWVCLANCQELFNDPQAYCYHDRIGGARCLDSGCNPWDEDKCMANGQVCRDGECVTECTQKSHCDALGFPAAFECIGNACQRPDL